MTQIQTQKAWLQNQQYLQTKYSSPCVAGELVIELGLLICIVLVRLKYLLIIPLSDTKENGGN